MAHIYTLTLLIAMAAQAYVARADGLWAAAYTRAAKGASKFRRVPQIIARRFNALGEETATLWSDGTLLPSMGGGAPTRYQTLLDRQASLKAEALALIDVEEPTEAQTERLTECEAELATVNTEVAAQQRIRETLRLTPAGDNLGAPLVNEVTAIEPQPATPVRPYPTLGHFLTAVARAAAPGAAPEAGLLAIQAAVTGASEGVASDGGFLVQQDLSAELLGLVHDTGLLYGRTDSTTVSANANGLKINAVDETSRVDGSRHGGVQAYWVAEGGTPTSTKPKFRRMELNLQKLMALYYATDELLQDAQALGQEASTAFSEEMGFKVDDAIFRGTGAGMPLGVLGHAGTVSIAKETGQAAATILKENIDKMFARMWAPSLSRAEWFINQDCWPALFSLAQVVGVGGVPVFLPPGGLSAAPFGMLYGRPVVPIEQSATLGTVGDILFADFSQYKTIEKGGVQADSSIHVQFLTDEMTFRFILRTDGQPKRNAPLTPFKGTNTLSSFITLATRA